MPTILTHALLPLIVSATRPGGTFSNRLIAAGMVAAMSPDADVVSRYFGIPHTHDFGHRGATHTILFALVLGALGALNSAALRARRGTAFLFLFLSTLSHPLTDMATNGGKGLMLFWPLDDDRFASPFRPVEVSPVGMRFFSADPVAVLVSELLWILLPITLIALIVRATLRHASPRLD